MIISDSQIKSNKLKMLLLSVSLMCFLLNQSNVIGGINFSIADIFFIFTFLILLIKKEFLFPVKSVIFFLIVSILILSTATFYVPNKFTFTPGLAGVTISYLKFIVVILYCFIGFNLERLGILKKGLKWFSYGTLIMGLMSISLTVLNLRIEALYDRSIRYKGLMNDPNYFSLIQIAAIAYFMGIKDIKNIYRYIAIIILAISVLLSGSKTGILSLLFYLSFKIIESSFKKNINVKEIIKGSIVLLFILTITLIVFNKIDSLLVFISQNIPTFNRISLLFTDFNSAVSEGGSGRAEAWEFALEIIKISPFIGIGIGTYTGITRELWNFNIIAHNTYLQLAVEWGLPLTVLFFSYVFFLIFKVTLNSKLKFENNIIFRDILIVLLIGSFAISLNNARLFWLILGALIFSAKKVNTINIFK